MKILIMGLPGTGKTYLAERLASKLQAVHFNADKVRATINSHLDFSLQDRIKHANSLGWMCQFVKDSGHIGIADFVCPTNETRIAFNPDYIIWMDTFKKGRYEDTNKLFVPPLLNECNLHITDFKYSVDDIAKEIIACRHKDYNL